MLERPPRRLGIVVLGLLLPGILEACQAKEPEPHPEAARVQVAALAPDKPLEGEFLLRAILSLKKQLGADITLLELQAVPFGVSLQLAKADKILEYTYEESEDRAEPGKVFGPFEAGLLGQGELERNLFPLAELDLDGIGKAFDVARRSVDPDDGVVERLVVRRFLPFGDGVRARIYIYSPRMPGSIDTNPNGIPLKR
jgi:hypothetical protein